MLLLRPNSLDKFSEQFCAAAAADDDRLLQRLKLLGDRDRLLVELALKHRLSLRQIGTALELSPGNVMRKLRRLVQRLHDPVVVALADPTCTLAPDLRQLGIERFLHGDSIAQLARRHQMTDRQAAAGIEFIRGWHRGMSARPARS